MKTWVVLVHEIVTRMVHYTVEADNLADARLRVLHGEATDESQISDGEVIDRIIGGVNGQQILELEG